MLGEADLISDESVEAHAPDYRPRYLRLIAALEAAPTLFVGTDLDDPGLVAALAETKGGGHRRFAVVLAPSVPAADAPHAALLDKWLVAQRFQHLDVEPIFVDLPFQGPQLLREIGSAARGEQSRYAARVDAWWRGWRDSDLGVGTPEDRAPQAAAEWERLIKSLRATIARSAGPGEYSIEVWVRDADRRSLCLSAASDPSARDGESEHPLRAVGHIATRAFARGYPVVETSDGTRRVAFNCILYGDVWDRLPVAVVVVKGGETLLDRHVQAEELGVVEQDVARLLDSVLGANGFG